MDTSRPHATPETARLRVSPRAIALSVAIIGGLGVAHPAFTDSGPPQAPPSAIQQTRVLTVNKGKVLNRILSPDRRHVATAVRMQPSSLFDALRPPGPTMVIGSPSPKPFHPAVLTAETTFQLYTDGLAEDVLSGICPHCITFSPDSRHLAYAACRDELPPRGAAYATPSLTWGIVHDGVMEQTFDDVGAPAFSPDGRHLAYVAISGGMSFLVMDGVSQAGVGASGSPTVTFSPDGNLAAYVASIGDTAFVVTEGVAGRRFPTIGDLSLCFSPDGSRLAYLAAANAEGSRCFVVVDGETGPECDVVIPAWRKPQATTLVERTDYVTGITFSADSRHVAYAAVDGRKWFMVIDGQAGPPYDTLAPPRFHGTDSLPTYAVQKGQKWSLIRNGVPDSVAYDALQYNPTTGPVGGHWAYAVREGKQWFMVVDGRRDPAVDELWVMDMVFSADGTHCAYPARAGGKEFVMVDGVAGPRWDGASSICFSPDGRRTAYVVRKGKKEFVLLDGVAGPMTDGVLRNGISFDPDSEAVEYFTVKDKTLWRIRQAAVAIPAEI